MSVTRFPLVWFNRCSFAGKMKDAGLPDQQDVGFRKLHLRAALLIHLDALVVVVDGYRQLLLGGILANDIVDPRRLVPHGPDVFYITRCRKIVTCYLVAVHCQSSQARCTLKDVSPLENIVEDLKALPPARLEVAAKFVHRLKRISEEERQAILAQTAGSLSPEDADAMEKAIEEGC